MANVKLHSPSLDDLVKKFQLQEKFLATEVSQKHLLKVSRSLDCWEPFAHAAGITVPEFFAIERDGHNEEDRRYKTLNKWHNKNGYFATFKMLIEILLEVDRTNIALEVCRMQDSVTEAEDTILDPSLTPVFFASKFWRLDGASIQNDAGRGVLIAVLNSGVNSDHAALQGKVKYGRNFVTKDDNPTNFIDTDQNSNGTALAGVAAGNHLIANNYPAVKALYTGFKDKLPLGVASQASLVICRVGSSLYLSAVTAALKWIWEHNCVVMDIAPSTTEAHLKECKLNHENVEENMIRIVSVSFELDDDYSEVKSYIDMLNTQGVICVTSAGNDGNDGEPGWPASYENVLSVGSVDNFGKLSSFSSRPFDVCTLGEDVLVAKNAGSNQSSSDAATRQLTGNIFGPSTGTPFAASAVAGLIAILVQCAREQGGQALAKKITAIKVLKQLFKMHLLSDDGKRLLQPQLVEAFFKNEVHNLGEVVRAFDQESRLPSPSTSLSESGEQHKYLKQLEELMIDKKAIDVRYLKLYFIGLSGLGKTTFRERFTRLLVNIKSLPPEERQRRSTHLAECTQVLAVSSDSKLELNLADNPDEAQTIFHYLYGSKSHDVDHSASEESNPDTSDHDRSEDSSVNHQESSSLQLPSDKPDDDHPPSRSSPSEGSSKPAAMTKHETSGTAKTEARTGRKVNIKKIFDRLREVIGSGKYAEELLGKILLNLIDMGGQPGFLEMLPFLSTGPGMYLVFLPLDKELDQQYEVTYEREEDRITPYKATYTVRETISQILASVSHHTTCDPTAERMLGDTFPEFKKVQPIATLVGTFKDKVDLKVKKTKLQEKLCEEFRSQSKEDLGTEIERILHSRLAEQNTDIPEQKIPESIRVDIENSIIQHLASEPFKREVKLRIDDELKKIHVALEEITSCFGPVIANPVSDAEHRFFAVDNFGGTDADLDPIRQHLHAVFKQKFKGAKIRIRPAQLLFGIILRKEFDIVTKDECFQIGKELGMEEQVEFTIWYLHHCVGALIHHPDIEDDEDLGDGFSFKDSIICSPQVVFNSISKLIVNCLLELHSNSSNTAFVETERNDWSKKGQFSLETIECCHSDKTMNDVKERRLIPVKQLVKLLQHVNLLSPIKTKRTVGHKQETVTRYFMPAILECSSAEELLAYPSSCDKSPAPIYITFECGYVPIGLFCAMIARLVSKGSDGILGLKWELDESCVKRNIVFFCVGVQYQITLVSHVNCYEIRVSEASTTTKSRAKLHDICVYVLATVQFVLKEINRDIKLTIAFDCPCERHQSDKRKCPANWCKLCEGAITGFMCGKENIPLTKSQNYWFAKEVQLGSNVQLKALPFKTKTDFSFNWNTNRPMQSSDSQGRLVLEAVTPEDCVGFYTCNVHKDGVPYFTVQRCLFAAISIAQSPPERQEVGEGQSVSLTVTATGTDRTYQWLRENKPFTEDNSFQGLNKDTLVIREATTDMSGSYSCRVTNNKSDEVSRPAKLIIVEAPKICQQPKDKVALEEEDVSLSVTAKGKNLTYKWRKHTNNFEDYLKNGEQYKDVNSPRLIIKNTTHKDAGKYSCEVSNLGGKVSSQTANLSINRHRSRIFYSPMFISVCVIAVALMILACGLVYLPITYSVEPSGIAPVSTQTTPPITPHSSTKNADSIIRPDSHSTSTTPPRTSSQSETSHTKQKKSGTIIRPGDRPEMTQLLNFTLGDGTTTINIVTKIGTNYRTFGNHLLKDLNKVDNIEAGFHFKPEPIVDRMLSDWMQGKGRRPVTWETLVDVLETTGLTLLADDIRGQYDLSPTGSYNEEL